MPHYVSYQLCKPLSQNQVGAETLENAHTNVRFSSKLLLNIFFSLLIPWPTSNQTFCLFKEPTHTVSSLRIQLAFLYVFVQHPAQKVLEINNNDNDVKKLLVSLIPAQQKSYKRNTNIHEHYSFML